jgi:hypothetical protein
VGRFREELIPDSSWKRAEKTLGPQASPTAARLSHILGMAECVWGNESDAAEWLNSPHPEGNEGKGDTPFSTLKSEACGRAIEALLAALEFRFPVECMVVFRMHPILYDAFDPAGAYTCMGGWPSAGTRVIYAAEQASLAVLETLLHAGGHTMPPRVKAQIQIPRGVSIESAAPFEMPESQAFGDREG